MPAYKNHLIKIHRLDGQLGLLKLAVNLEKHEKPEKLNLLSSDGFYKLQIIDDSPNFIIAAVPQKSQLSDKRCGILALNSQGEKGRLSGNTVMPDKKCF